MRLGSLKAKPTKSSGWLDGDERVFVSTAKGGLSVAFKVYANSEDRRASAEMLLASVSRGWAEDAEFSILEEDDGAILVFGYGGNEFVLGDVPEPLRNRLFTPHWEKIDGAVIVEKFSVELSVAGREVDRNRVMRVADDEVALESMSDRQFNEMLSSVYEALLSEVYVVKIRLTIMGKQEDLLLNGGK